MTPRRIALTGGIATGKSHCLKGFAALGVPVIDADELARAVVRPGSGAFSAIVARFGPGILTGSEEIDRAALGQIVFADPAARRDLEAIVHPQVYAAIGAWFDTLSAPLGIADIPLLFETGREKDFDAVIVCACRVEQQLARLLDRGHSEAQARQRIASQWPIDEKARRADYVIDTSRSLEETDAQMAQVLRRLRE